MAFKEALMMLAVLLGFVTVPVAGHGRMIDPPSRNSAWRYGFPNPVHYTDNELNCGGFSVQWESNKGRCGVCGDPYHRDDQLHVYPGKYANGIITKTYTQGQDITVLIEVTSNHRGFFTFRIGDIGNPPITQEKLAYVLKQPNGAEAWQIPLMSGNEVFRINLVLPVDLSCKQCVMQWWWKTGNSWGCDDTGCGLGKGERQETFVNCADVTILSNGGTGPIEPPTAPPTAPPTEPATAPPTEPATAPPTEPATAPPTEPATAPPTEPATAPPTEPATESPVDTLPPVTITPPPQPGGCKGTGTWSGNAGMDKWCRRNCARGYCPPSVCKCSTS